jgi:hypothetical protein
LVTKDVQADGAEATGAVAETGAAGWLAEAGVLACLPPVEVVVPAGLEAVAADPLDLPAEEFPWLEVVEEDVPVAGFAATGVLPVGLAGSAGLAEAGEVAGGDDEPAFADGLDGGDAGAAGGELGLEAVPLGLLLAAGADGLLGAAGADVGGSAVPPDGWVGFAAMPPGGLVEPDFAGMRAAEAATSSRPKVEPVAASLIVSAPAFSHVLIWSTVGSSPNRAW